MHLHVHKFPFTQYITRPISDHRQAKNSVSSFNCTSKVLLEITLKSRKLTSFSNVRHDKFTILGILTYTCMSVSM